MLIQEKRVPQDFSKITEIGVIVPKEIVKITSKIEELTQEIELMEKFDKDLNKNIFDGVDEKDLENTKGRTYTQGTEVIDPKNAKISGK